MDICNISLDGSSVWISSGQRPSGIHTSTSLIKYCIYTSHLCDLSVVHVAVLNDVHLTQNDVLIAQNHPGLCSAASLSWCDHDITLHGNALTGISHFKVAQNMILTWNIPDCVYMQVLLAHVISTADRKCKDHPSYHNMTYSLLSNAGCMFS